MDRRKCTKMSIAIYSPKAKKPVTINILLPMSQPQAMLEMIAFFD